MIIDKKFLDDLSIQAKASPRLHSLECLESGSVLLECKDGRYEELRKNELICSNSYKNSYKIIQP